MTKTFTIVRTATLGLIAAGFVAGAVPAMAATDPVPQAELNVAGTDFTSAKAVDRLITRLHRIATEICAPDSDARTPMNDDQRTCYDTAVKTAMAQINSKREQAMRETGVHVAAAESAAKPGQ